MDVFHFLLPTSVIGEEGVTRILLFTTSRGSLEIVIPPLSPLLRSVSSCRTTLRKQSQKACKRRVESYVVNVGYVEELCHRTHSPEAVGLALHKWSLGN